MAFCMVPSRSVSVELPSLHTVFRQLLLPPQTTSVVFFNEQLESCQASGKKHLVGEPRSIAVIPGLCSPSVLFHRENGPMAMNFIRSASCIMCQCLGFRNRSHHKCVKVETSSLQRLVQQERHSRWTLPARQPPKNPLASAICVLISLIQLCAILELSFLFRRGRSISLVMLEGECSPPWLSLAVVITSAVRFVACKLL